MNQEPIFEEVIQLLLTRLRAEMVPAVLNSEDAIKFSQPNAEEDYRFGVLLHDIEEIRLYGVPTSTRISKEARQNPALPLSLHFLMYANRNVPFDGMSAMDEAILLEAAMRAVHSFERFEIGGQKALAELHPLSNEEKVSLWQSLNSPMQPAVYLTIEPIHIPSSRIRRVPAVEAVEIAVKHKGGGRP